MSTSVEIFCGWNYSLLFKRQSKVGGMTVVVSLSVKAIECQVEEDQDSFTASAVSITVHKADELASAVHGRGDAQDDHQ